MSLSHLRNCTALVSLVVALTACGNRVSEETASLKQDYAGGRFQSAYNQAKAIEDNPSQYSSEAVEYARTVREKTEVRLAGHYGGNIRAHVAGGNVDAALGMWTELQDKNPQFVEKDMDLHLRMMRVYALRQLWDPAIQTAETVRSRATKMEEREEADKFISTYQDLKSARIEFEQLQAQVVEVGERTGIELGGGIGCGASDQLTDADKAIVEAWEEANRRVASLNYSLTRLIPPPPADMPSPEADETSG